ncbi:MAG: hypothetical protein IKH75_22650 [Ruminococcus sp.]|nr:hypothetical protein [Ruminococcus sp.]
MENVFLIKIDNKIPYLQSDIEYGGDIGICIELMDFILDSSLSFLEANDECRNIYAGGITFIEYSNIKIAEQEILSDFLSIKNSYKFHSYELHYLKCNNNELYAVAKKYSDNTLLYLRADYNTIR